MDSVENNIESKGDIVREEIDDFLAYFSSENLIEARDDIREMCWRCKRPVKACWCKHLPDHKIPLNTTIHILQHPYEKSRCLQTAEMLFQAFDEDHCRLYRGKRFPFNKYPGLHELASLPNCLLLFPSADSVELKTYLSNSRGNKRDGDDDGNGNGSGVNKRDDDGNGDGNGVNKRDGDGNGDGNGVNNRDDDINDDEKDEDNKEHEDKEFNNIDDDQNKDLQDYKNHTPGTDNNHLKSLPIYNSEEPNNQAVCEPRHTKRPLSQNSSHSSCNQLTTTTAYHLFVIDGTWYQAKGIIFCNPFLHSLTQVHLEDTGVSRYTIRTQPTDQGLSTVESVSIALTLLEERTDIYPTLMQPLEALCRTQLEHGAVVHHSKERLELLGLKYPMKDNYKLMPEDEEKMMRKKKRKMNRMMNRLRLKNGERIERLNGVFGGGGGDCGKNNNNNNVNNNINKNGNDKSCDNVSGNITNCSNTTFNKDVNNINNKDLLYKES